MFFQKVILAGKIQIVYKTTHRLSHLFRFKDLVSSDLRSHVIYQFKCPSCNNGYIAEKHVWHFKVRSCLHLGTSPFSGKIGGGGVATAITKHKKKAVNVGLKDFKIIGNEEDYHKRLIKESLFIKQFDYEFNKQQASTVLHLF